MNSRSLRAAALIVLGSQNLTAQISVRPLVPFPNPPVVQMLVPGFSVRELPLTLNNINNFAYAPDGRLFALAYDGNVFQLKDADGDGLEDTASLFFNNEKNEIAPSIGMAWGPGGLYIASRGRVIRLRDKGDGTGELETVSSGWVPPTKAAGSSLDAVGLAVDSSGTIFFGLGCDAWSDAYRPNKQTGGSDYDIKSERGTIIKLSPDGKRESIATGLRFTVSLAFNAAGDLFCTDQEGATWLPNGNPFDELLHIQRGRHYGFPPRHPKYLPDVIDEPSTFDYAPQHQSTCGLHFNEPAAGGGEIFGPDWWRGDAIVAGESRGKIWRTKLVKTASGYIAQNQLIACLGMLVIDAIPTPRGDLLVTCHSGAPDWGTGPKGKGKLFKISATDPRAPRPVLAYAAGPTETRVIFDQPIDPAAFKNMARQTSVNFGRYVAAGDRFESFRPGYQAIKDQLELPRYEMAVLSAGVSPDNRSISLQTSPRRSALNYSIILPAKKSEPKTRGVVGQVESMDLLSDLTGAEAQWIAQSGHESWSGWLPHLDLTAARGFSTASAEHERLFSLLKNRGQITLRAQLDLYLMLRTVIQPGATLEFSYPTETVTVVFKSKGRLRSKAGARGQWRQISDNELRVTAPVSAANQWIPVDLTLATGSGEPQLEVSWFTAEDDRRRPLPVRRILLPWAEPTLGEQLTTRREIPEIAGGDWARGRKVFFSEPASCFKCHQAGGEGGKIGPDLSNLTQRDYASVLRDITQPSAAINPDHLAYLLEVKGGEDVSGVIVEDSPEKVVVGQANGQTVTVPRARITAMRALPISIMPEGLLKTLGAKDQRDLLTFLLRESGEKTK